MKYVFEVIDRDSYELVGTFSRVEDLHGNIPEALLDFIKNEVYNERLGFSTFIQENRICKVKKVFRKPTKIEPQRTFGK